MTRTESYQAKEHDLRSYFASKRNQVISCGKYTVSSLRCNTTQNLLPTLCSCMHAQFVRTLANPLQTTCLYTHVRIVCCRSTVSSGCIMVLNNGNPTWKFSFVTQKKNLRVISTPLLPILVRNSKIS